jgi:hypothetical protein
MVQKIKKPFKESQIFVETISGNVIARGVDYYYGRTSAMF